MSALAVETPLHLAAFKGHAACVEYLLKKNADVGLQNWQVARRMTWRRTTR